MRTRFAPSPTGDLHLGGAWTALASWWLAGREGGTFVVRIEDLDPPRVVRESAARILDDLRWLGLTWDEPLAVQSERSELYEAALATLTARGATFACDCSRGEIARLTRVASAPHARIDEESVYPGRCRTLDPEREWKRAPATRLRVPDETVAFVDGVLGPLEQRVAADVGDFVLRRGDGVFAYQLAVVVDDLAMGITDVVRGADLAMSTPRQILLARMLGCEAPRYWHVPLVLAADGERLAKRTPGASVRALREAGVAPEEILGELAHGLGITPSPEPRGASSLLACARSHSAGLSPRAWRIPRRWAALGQSDAT